jgi:FtsZ-binding cell division protein ZapB
LGLEVKELKLANEQLFLSNAQLQLHNNKLQLDNNKLQMENKQLIINYNTHINEPSQSSINILERFL